MTDLSVYNSSKQICWLDFFMGESVMDSYFGQEPNFFNSNICQLMEFWFWNLIDPNFGFLYQNKKTILDLS